MTMHMFLHHSNRPRFGAKSVEIVRRKCLCIALNYEYESKIT